MLRNIHTMFSSEISNNSLVRCSLSSFLAFSSSAFSLLACRLAALASSSILVVDFSARCLAALLVSFAFVRFFFLGEASSATSEKDIYFSVRGEAFLKL